MNSILFFYYVNLNLSNCVGQVEKMISDSLRIHLLLVAWEEFLDLALTMTDDGRGFPRLGLLCADWAS